MKHAYAVLMWQPECCRWECWKHPRGALVVMLCVLEIILAITIIINNIIIISSLFATGNAGVWSCPCVRPQRVHHRHHHHQLQDHHHHHHPYHYDRHSRLQHLMDLNPTQNYGQFIDEHAGVMIIIMVVVMTMMTTMMMMMTIIMHA